jgi:uncharacterized membrane protein (UPF0127 family)
MSSAAAGCSPILVVAPTAGSRLRGLLFRRRSEWAGRWLILRRTHAVHTLLMGYPIDVAFCDADCLVIATRECVRPGIAWVGCRGACLVVERPSGGAGERWLSVGERLEML